MIHHLVPEKVVEAIDLTASRSGIAESTQLTPMQPGTVDAELQPAATYGDLGKLLGGHSAQSMARSCGRLMRPVEAIAGEQAQPAPIKMRMHAVAVEFDFVQPIDLPARS
jgi:hypothetical protein